MLKLHHALFHVCVCAPGGLHLYYPHHHGSTALQAGAGAAGMIVVNDNPYIEADMPPQLAKLPQVRAHSRF
jgi:FtsP/CotA-like multicopper oxidase with cupredoxin domain